MNHVISPISMLLAACLLLSRSSAQNSIAANPASAEILLVAGEIAPIDKPGHHDYLGGCRLLASLLKQTPGVSTTLVTNGWPDDGRLLTRARAVVFYTDGAGKQAYLSSADRVRTLEEAARQGKGLVFLHQAVDYPDAFVQQAIGWQGGAYVQGKSGRGHWVTHHRRFPEHPITRGVKTWEIFDGWLNKIQFTDGMNGITPLVWSGQKHAGDPEGGMEDVVGWAFERPDGGRSFCFTGVDAHSAWSLPGVRQLVVNGILWSAGMSIPENGSPNAADEALLTGFISPRLSPRPIHPPPAGAAVRTENPAARQNPTQGGK